MNRLLELAERCEQAGPDRRIDGLIFAHLNDKRIIIGSEPGRFPQKAIYGTPLDMLEMLKGDDRMAHDAAEYLNAPTYTTSLDAAMTLVPVGLNFGCGSKDATGTAWAWAGQPDGAVHNANAPTPALALCAAALRARAQEVSSE